MQVREMMSRDVRTCQPTDSTNHAAEIMWESDCGCVPVVEANGKVVGIITDRDICMAAYTQGRPLTEIDVGSVGSRNVVTVREGDSLHQAEKLMHDAQVRRLPVLDSNERLVGLLSISDFARRVRDLAGGIPAHIVGALAGISQRRSVHPEGDKPGSETGRHPSSTTTELKKELKKSLSLLQTLRDEVRVKLHLGSLEVKDQWNRLEPHLGEIEKKADELTEASRAMIADAVKRLEGLRSSLSELS
jgi:CBS domain-containing protein